MKTVLIVALLVCLVVAVLMIAVPSVRVTRIDRHRDGKKRRD